MSVVLILRIWSFDGIADTSRMEDVNLCMLSNRDIRSFQVIV